MSRGLAEQIALLDGLDGNFIQAPDQINASNGGNYSGGSNYEDSIPLMTSSIGLADMPGFSGDQDMIEQYNAINASNGANWSGGSNYPDDSIPLMTSSIGLAGASAFADADLLREAGMHGYGQIPNVLPPRHNVIDPSGGANYVGGSSYAPGIPLLPSRAGLAGFSPCNQSHRAKIFAARRRAAQMRDASAVRRLTNMLNRCAGPQAAVSAWK